MPAQGSPFNSNAQTRHFHGRNNDLSHDRPPIDRATVDCAVSDKESVMPLQKYIIERNIPKVGTFERDQLREAAKASNAALAQLGPDIQWVESYVADDKTFCVYLAKDEAAIRRHAEVSGFPASKITEVRRMIDPTTAAG
jgi:hypothetical protein